MAPRWPLEGSKKGPERPKMAPRGPMMAPRWPLEGSKKGPDSPGPSSRRAQTAQDGLKRVPRLLAVASIRQNMPILEPQRGVVQVDFLGFYFYFSPIWMWKGLGIPGSQEQGRGRRSLRENSGFTGAVVREQAFSQEVGGLGKP